MLGPKFGEEPSTLDNFFVLRRRRIPVDAHEHPADRSASYAVKDVIIVRRQRVPVHKENCVR